MKTSPAGAAPHVEKWADEDSQVVRVALVAPALAWRMGLRALLEANARIHVTAEAATLSDLEPGLPGVDVLVVVVSDGPIHDLQLVASASEPVSILLLVEADPGAGWKPPFLPLRAWGVLPVDATAGELSSAVLALAEGLLVGSPAYLGSLLADEPGKIRAEGEPLVEALTEREIEVLQLLAQGLANKQIAVALGISEHTVKFHASAIFGKLGAASRMEAVRIGVRTGLVTM